MIGEPNRTTAYFSHRILAPISAAAASEYVHVQQPLTTMSISRFAESRLGNGTNHMLGAGPGKRSDGDFKSIDSETLT